MIANQEQLAPCSIEPTWKRWFAWRPVELQSGGRAWLRFVEYRQFKITIAPYMLGGEATVTHYRSPQVLKERQKTHD